MSNNENPIHAPIGGRPREGDEPRVSRTMTIDADTNRTVDAAVLRLRSKDPQATAGRVLDRMATFCTINGFDVLKPTNKILKTKTRTKVSTPPPAKPAATSGKA